MELSREDFIELADTSRVDDIKILRRMIDEDNIHSDLLFRLVDRQVTFLNGGFPANFDGRVNCVPAKYMQPTATSMVAGSVQAVASETVGLLELDAHFCGWLDHAFRGELGVDAARFLGSLP